MVRGIRWFVLGVAAVALAFGVLNLVAAFMLLSVDVPFTLAPEHRAAAILQLVTGAFLGVTATTAAWFARRIATALANLMQHARPTERV